MLAQAPLKCALLAGVTCMEIGVVIDCGALAALIGTADTSAAAMTGAQVVMPTGVATVVGGTQTIAGGYRHHDSWGPATMLRCTRTTSSVGGRACAVNAAHEPGKEVASRMHPIGVSAVSTDTHSVVEDLLQ